MLGPAAAGERVTTEIPGGRLTLRSRAPDPDGRVEVRACVHNTTDVPAGLDRADSLGHSLLSTHLVVEVSAGRFVSPLEAGLTSENIWPVLAGADVSRIAMGTDEDLYGNIVEAYERSWPRPRALILSFPHNPTTATVDLEFMQRVVDFARQRELVIVHDFAYADLGFDGYEPPSILQAEGAKEVAVELYTLTKSFSMAGWRSRPG